MDRMKVLLVSDSHKEGAEIMVQFVSRRLLSDALVQWLKSVYYDEIIIQESFEATREKVNQ